MAAASVVATTGSLPVFLVSAVAVLVRADLGFDEAGLGAAVSAFFAAAAVSSVHSGRLVERIGGRGALVLGAGLSGTALLGIGLSPTWSALVLALVVGGLANAVCQLAANLRLSGGVPLESQGVAFGVKQSANAIASLFGGAAVPLVAINFGWRPTFVLAAAVAWGAGAFQARGARRNRVPRRARAASPVLDRPPLVYLALGLGFTAAANTALSAFIVEYAVSTGLATGTAGTVLAVSSLAGLSTRIVLGAVADRRRGGELTAVAGMLYVGAAVLAAFPFVSGVPLVTLATVLAYAVGWGWPGLLNLAIVRGNDHAPAAATGVTQVGAYIGGVIGPVAFGFVVAGIGYGPAWTLAAVWQLAAGSFILAGRARARRSWAARSA